MCVFLFAYIISKKFETAKSSTYELVIALVENRSTPLDIII